MRSVLAAGIVVAIAASPAATDDWPRDDHYDSALRVLHATLDYAFLPTWTRIWERDLVKRNGLRGTAGSVTTDELLSVLQVDVSQPIGRGFRVLYVANRNESVRRDLQLGEQFVGLEASLFGESGVQLLGDPAGSKEELDMLLGVLVADVARERYLRLWLRLDDPFWGRKNDRGGSSVREAVGPQWAARFVRGRWELFSEGRYSRPYERVFENPEKSPVIAREERGHGESETRVRWFESEGSWAEAELAHYRFEERVEARAPATGWSYENRIIAGRLAGGFPLSRRFRGRAELRHVRQDAEARGARDYDFRRRDVPWALHVEWLPTTSQVWGLGYLASAYEWDYVPRDGTAPYDRASSVDKLALAWTFLFSEEARVLLSLSHEPEVNRFGGGNLQLLATF